MKYKHNLYDWLGVDKVEIAVMAELLLRGEQTIGELRGRAARMEAIADLPALQPVLKSLVENEVAAALDFSIHEKKHKRKRRTNINKNEEIKGI